MGAAPSIQQGGAQASKPWARPQTPPRTDWLGLPELPGVCFCADGRDGKGFAIRQATRARQRPSRVPRHSRLRQPSLRWT